MFLTCALHSAGYSKCANMIPWRIAIHGMHELVPLAAKTVSTPANKGTCKGTCANGNLPGIVSHGPILRGHSHVPPGPHAGDAYHASLGLHAGGRGNAPFWRGSSILPPSAHVHNQFSQSADLQSRIKEDLADDCFMMTPRCLRGFS